MGLEPRGPEESSGEYRRAVVLLNLGGPDTRDAIRPFLQNLFSDPDIIRLPPPLRPLLPALARRIAKSRAPRVAGYYARMSPTGASPLLALTRGQAIGVQKALLKAGLKARVAIAMRHWHPFTSQAVQELIDAGIREVVLLPLYPQYSSTTTGSSIKAFWRELAERGYADTFTVAEVQGYYDHPLYIQAMVELIEQAFTRFTVPRNDIFLLFSSHGLPQSVVDRGDPYREQIDISRRSILEKLDFNGRAAQAFQSRVAPMKWLSPYTNEMIEALGREGVKNLLMVPLGFVSDHLETLYEMDILYRDLAHSCGVERVERVAALGDWPTFMEALADSAMHAFNRPF